MKRSLLILSYAIVLTGCATSSKVGSQPAAGDWKLAVQAWTFNKLTFFDAVDTTAKLGIHYIEAFPGQKIGGGIDAKMVPDMEPAVREKVLAKLKSAGVTLVNFGVATPGDEAGWVKLFDFAKALGIQTIVSEPQTNQFVMLDKLTQQYGINIALHNHPDPSRYWNPETVLKVTAGCNPRIGACADTGHWVRSGLDPVACLQKLQGHIISLHFKDLNEFARKGHDVVWGTGVSNAPAMLAELRRQGFTGVFSIEYEHTTPELPDNVGHCAKAFAKFAALSECQLRGLGAAADIAKVHQHATTGAEGMWK
jgi:sugar phosphate isomerase/epimerase